MLAGAEAPRGETATEGRDVEARAGREELQLTRRVRMPRRRSEEACRDLDGALAGHDRRHRDGESRPPETGSVTNVRAIQGRDRGGHGNELPSGFGDVLREQAIEGLASALVRLVGAH